MSHCIAMSRCFAMTLLVFAVSCGESNSGSTPGSSQTAPGVAGGSSTAPPLPSNIQGDWQFNEQRTLAEWRGVMSPVNFQAHQRTAKALHKAGLSLHADITVSGSSIIGRGKVQPQYDMIQWQQNQSKVEGRAWYHEDRHDPGDMTQMALTLERNGNELWLTQAGRGGGPPTVYIFSRE